MASALTFAEKKLDLSTNSEFARLQVSLLISQWSENVKFEKNVKAMLIFPQYVLSLSQFTFILPSQLWPLPENPALHEHTNDPGVSEQSALTSQFTVWRHSLMFSQAVPFPVNPPLHWQRNDPGVFVQSAWWWQVWVPATHSSLSKHWLPVFVKPL